MSFFSFCKKKNTACDSIIHRYDLSPGHLHVRRIAFKRLSTQDVKTNQSHVPKYTTKDYFYLVCKMSEHSENVNQVS